MKTLTLTAIALASLATASTATASREPERPTPTLTILHLNVGCHSWSLNGGPWRAEQTVRLREGQSLRVINYDRKAHRLVQLSGGALAISRSPSLLRHSPSNAAMPIPPEPGSPAEEAADAVMGYRGASLTATFEEPGSYVLSTVEAATFPGEDAESSGPINTLTVRVLVFPRYDHPRP